MHNKVANLRLVFLESETFAGDMNMKIVLALLLVFVIQISDLLADTHVKIGFIGSLSSFAANYGQASLDGAQLAIEELSKEGTNYQLIVEDDQSSAKNTVTAYYKLRNVDKVNYIITGTWWANSIVKQAERDKVILLSCETLFNDDAVLGSTYFILNGDLRDWVNVYEPLFQEKKLRQGAIVRFVSGFGSTLEKEMRSLFGKNGRSFVGAIEYADIEMSTVNDIVLKLKKLNPEVVYIDAQPSSIATLFKKLRENQFSKMTILANTSAEDAHKAGLYDITGEDKLFFTKRTISDEIFREKFVKRYAKPPTLSADLAYYAAYLVSKVRLEADPLKALRAGILINNKKMIFNELNVYTDVAQEIYTVKDGKIIPWLVAQER